MLVFLAIANLVGRTSGTSGPTELKPGQDLSGDRSVESEDGRYKLTMADSGRLVLEDDKGERVWSPPRTQAVPGAFARFREDGEFVVLAPDEVTELYTTGTDGTSADSLTVTNSGRAVLTDTADKVVWDSGGIAPVIYGEKPRDIDTLNLGEVLHDGQSLQSANGAYSLKLDGGALVMHRASELLTLLAQADEDAALAMQRDGNLVLYEHPHEPRGRFVWSTRTPGLEVERLTLRNDGTLVLDGPSGVVCSLFSPGGGGSDEPCPAQSWVTG